MSEELNVKFVNEYVNVMKKRIDALTMENIRLETQMNVNARDMQTMKEHNEFLQIEINKLTEKNKKRQPKEPIEPKEDF